MRKLELEHEVPFTGIPANGGTSWLPIVKVAVISPDGSKRKIPLIFDTGASTTTLRADLAPLLGAADWTDGQAEQTNVVGGTQTVYRFPDVEIEFLGERVTCPVNLAQLPHNSYFMGLLGREDLFDRFGFGFWESERCLFITTDP